MKKLFLLGLILFTTNSCCIFKQYIPVTITENNLVFIDTEINGVLKISMLADSGASETNIPFPIFYTLVQTGSVVRGDMLESKTYVLADGSLVSCDRFMIKKIRIGETTLYNIECSISMSPDSPLLLGQNIMSKLKVVTFDYNKSRLIID